MRSATYAMIIDIVLDRVSIHALLAECDDLADINTFLERVSIHALLAECDGNPRTTKKQ